MREHFLTARTYLRTTRQVFTDLMPALAGLLKMDWVA